MQIESSFDGYDLNYLSFETDKAYVNRMFNNYEKNCKILGSYRELTDKGIIIYINSLDDNDKICILKNEGYTSGLIFAQTGSIFSLPGLTPFGRVVRPEIRSPSRGRSSLLIFIRHGETSFLT